MEVPSSSAVVPTEYPSGTTAPPVKRMGAFFLDMFLLYIVQNTGALFGKVLAVALMTATAKAAPGADEVQGVGQSGLFFGWMFWSSAFFIINYVVLQGFFGGTVGKLFLGLKVRNDDGSEISPLKSIGRTASYWLSALPFYLGFLMFFWNKKAKGLHDFICGTVVVSSPKTKLVTLPANPLKAFATMKREGRDRAA